MNLLWEGYYGHMVAALSVNGSYNFPNSLVEGGPSIRGDLGC